MGIKKILFLFCGLVCFRVHATESLSSLNWQIIQTEHFEIIYPKDLSELAKVYARQSELALKELAPYFGDIPEKTYIVLSDEADNISGSAHFIPFSVIRLSAFRPRGRSLFLYNNWARLLIMHELTHVLTFEPTRSFNTGLRYIFGNTIKPNALLPRWYLEGLAVELETKLTDGGRLKSSRTEAIFRALYLDQGLNSEGIDRINETSIPYWPFGHRPYILGGALMHQILKDTGVEDFKNQLHLRYSGRVPFWINAPLKDLTESDYKEYLEATYQELNKKISAQLGVIDKAGVSKKKIMPTNEDMSYSPSISPNGKHLVYLAGMGFKSENIYLATRKKPELFQLEGALKLGAFAKVSGLSWSKNSKTIYFSAVPFAPQRPIYDLYSLDVKTKEIKRLTEGERALEPQLSPSDQYIIYTRDVAGKSSIWQMHISSKKKELLLETENTNSVYFHPTYTRNNEFVYIKHIDENDQGLWKYNIDSQEDVQLTTDENVFYLKKTKFGLMYSSDRSGVPNLYLYRKGEPLRLTNTKTEILDGDIDPIRKLLVHSELSSKGFQLYTSKKLRAISPQSKTPSLFNFSKNAQSSNEVQALPDYTEESYGSLAYMYPRFWVPWFYSSDTGTTIQASTEVTDPIDSQAYAINFSYDTFVKEPNFSLNYTNSMYRIMFGANYLQSNWKASGSDEERETTSLSYGILYKPNGKYSFWTTRLFMLQEEIDTRIGNLKRSGPLLESASQHQFGSSNLSSIFQHKEFLGSGQELEYSRTLLDLNWKWTQSKKHPWSGQIRLAGIFADKLNIAQSYYVGDSNLGASTSQSQQGAMLSRGYPSGTFSGRSFHNMNLSFSGPLSKIYKGFDTKAFFLRNLYFTPFIDLIAVDGWAYNDKNNSIEPQDFDMHASAGVDFTLSTTFGYHLPLNFILGLYYGIDDEYQGGFQTFIGLGFESLDSLGH